MKMDHGETGPPTGRALGCRGRCGGTGWVPGGVTEDSLGTEAMQGLESYFQLRLYSEGICGGIHWRGFG